MAKYFSTIIGQKKAQDMLTSQLKSGNLGQSYLFLGADGTGKELLAKNFAEYILCDKGGEDDCPSCNNFRHGVHPDFIYINGSSGIKIDDIKQAIERIALSPNVSKRKVFCATRCENMGIEAANALLKTFEEPPADSIIILTASSEKSLPETIVSRAQKIKLRSLSSKELIDYLEKNFPDVNHQEIALYAGGSLGRALDLVKNKDTFEASKSDYEAARLILGRGEVADKFKVLNTYEKQKRLPYLFDQIILFLTEDIVSDDNGESLTGLGLLERGEMMGKILKIKENLDYNVNLRMNLEQLILEFSLND
jgi:DNA polymerase-3 subunit delta'